MCEYLSTCHKRIPILTSWFIVVGATLVLGGSQVLAGLSGVNVYAACFIVSTLPTEVDCTLTCLVIQVPIAVAAYVIQGGLRSTFVADYLHTVILFVAIFIFAFTLYTSDDYAGSPGKVYDLLVEAGNKTPLAGNRHGSWLTFQSSTGIKYAAVIFLGSFSTVWLDQAYWQRAIASKPETSVKAYLLGGVSTERPSLPRDCHPMFPIVRLALADLKTASMVRDPLRFRHDDGLRCRGIDRFLKVSYLPGASQRSTSRWGILSPCYCDCSDGQKWSRVDAFGAVHGSNFVSIGRTHRCVLLVDI